ncbi:hypothetical protein KAJ27_14590 [bacterium]|nr:hypothetical protein [bacterium]
MKKLSIMIAVLVIFAAVVAYSQEFMIEDSELWCQKGKTFYDRKDFAKAKEALNLSLDMWPGNKTAKKLLERMDNTKIIDGKKGKVIAGWTVKKNKSLPIVSSQKIIAVDNRVVLNDDVFHWMKKGDNFYARGNLEQAFDAYRIAHEMAPTNVVIKEKMDKMNVHRQNAHFNNLYPAKKVIKMGTLTPRREAPAAIKVVTSGGSLLAADPIYKEVITEVGAPQIPVDNISLVEQEDNVFPNLRLQELVIRVKKGMTFEKIFKRYLKNYRDMKKVAVYNKIRNIHKIKPDMLIRIPVKYLNLDYVDQYFSKNHGTRLYNKVEIAMPRDIGLPIPVQVKKRSVALYTPLQTDVELKKLKKQITKKNDKEIHNLKKEVKVLKKLLVKAIKKNETKVVQKNPAKIKQKYNETINKRKLSNIISDVKDRKKEVAKDQRKREIVKLSNKISEKERLEKLATIREKLKQLKKRYYSKKKPSEKDYKHQQEVKGLKEKIYQMTLELSKYKKETIALKKKPVVEKVVLDSIVKRFKTEIDKNQRELSSRKRIILKLNEQLIRQNKQTVLHNKAKIEKSKISRENQKLEKELKDVKQQLDYTKDRLKKKSYAKNDPNAPRTVIVSSSSADSHFKIAMEYWKKGLFSEAVDEYKKAVELDPAFLLRDDKGLTEAALNYARTTIKSRKSSMSRLHYKLAVIYQRKGFLNKALTEYKEILTETPNEEEVFFNMGLIFEQMKNYKSALESFEKISSLPKVSEKYVRMATTKIESIATKMKK